MMNERASIPIKLILANIFTAIFPWVSALFLCMVPDFLQQHLNRGQDRWDFYAVYIGYLLIISLFLYLMFCKENVISVIADMIGLAGVAMLHSADLCRILPGEFYWKLWSLFPFHFFLFELLGIMFILNGFTHYKRGRKKKSDFTDSRSV